MNISILFHILSLSILPLFSISSMLLLKFLSVYFCYIRESLESQFFIYMLCSFLLCSNEFMYLQYNGYYSQQRQSNPLSSYPTAYYYHYTPTYPLPNLSSLRLCPSMYIVMIILYSLCLHSMYTTDNNSMTASTMLKYFLIINPNTMFIIGLNTMPYYSNNNTCRDNSLLVGLVLMELLLLILHLSIQQKANKHNGDNSNPRGIISENMKLVQNNTTTNAYLLCRQYIGFSIILLAYYCVIDLLLAYLWVNFDIICLPMCMGWISQYIGISIAYTTNTIVSLSMDAIPIDVDQQNTAYVPITTNDLININNTHSLFTMPMLYQVYDGEQQWFCTLDTRQGSSVRLSMLNNMTDMDLFTYGQFLALPVMYWHTKQNTKNIPNIPNINTDTNIFLVPFIYMFYQCISCTLPISYITTYFSHVSILPNDTDSLFLLNIVLYSLSSLFFILFVFSITIAFSLKYSYFDARINNFITYSSFFLNYIFFRQANMSVWFLLSSFSTFFHSITYLSTYLIPYLYLSIF